ncbi:hypothetical protein F511_28080 [Dorcoceras hygrometricum]|uniref:Uncharacterized protein n=1 Tax=Dorcoceras hygrometricum TaxID=472368 RepID=A0A2Z7CQF4_9LAMI|nr:hypothetical protein F511_28080 [Dorcoceras hygrometricum]
MAAMFKALESSGLRDIAAQDEEVLTLAETDSVQIAIQRRLYIVAKYREMLLRKFLEAHRKNFRSNQPTTAVDLQIIDLLSDAHLFSLETLQTQMRAHGLTSSCWIQTMILVNGSWIIQEGGDFWKLIPRPVASRQWEIPPQRSYVDTLAPISEFFKIVRKCWAEFCIEVVQFSVYVLLKLVGTHNFCRALVIRGTVRDFEVNPTEFCGVFRRGLDVQLISSDSSSSFVHPDPDYLSTSSSSASPLDFTADIPQLEQSPAVITHISMPTADVTTPDFTESFAQLRASVNQIKFEKVQARDDVYKLKDVLLLHISSLERRFTEISDQRTQKAALSTELDVIRKDVQDQKAALFNDLMEFHVQAQEKFNTLTSQLSELVDYINRGGDVKKGEGSSSRGPLPPNDRSRPGSGDSSRGRGSRSEPARKRGGGGGSHRREGSGRDWKYWINL